ncbi:Spy/CpxP family protein refolding chaperone [Algoriphagus hitonicola]|uniref:TonB-dependent outer membrane receptor, SusC/RagA subfamily, signature region n=1 Tax=Algoriphagus hitonicola TaxID=435880 RepID=A0A1I2W013_9BACT|nr:periplasmic heavy metal sensor [Algoriphagus hitonicola]SFG94788.1 TonB-dependent outer membrane receptor, SusC/RagA subfamily, signature region [Algoriphagus hitonicola]
MKNLVVIGFLLLSNLSLAQDIFKKNLYSADQIMAAREKINLSESQADKIKKLHAENAGEFSTLKWDLDEANTKLEMMLKEPKVDPLAATKQLEKVLQLENQLKKKQLATLVAIKNELSESQILALDRQSLGISQTLSGRVQGIGKSETSGTALVTSGSKFRFGYPRPGISIAVAGENQENQPLYVIKSSEETIEKSSMTNLDIDPNDIESISVLKDKSAAEVYGEKGKNGVIIITLKDGVKVKYKK